MGKKYAKNTVVVILLFIIGISGIISCKGKEIKTVEITDKTLHQIGRFESTPEGNMMHAGKGQAGFLVFGPYWPLKEGIYRVKFNLMVMGETNHEVARIDVNIMDKITSRPITSPVEKRIILIDTTKWQEHEIYFSAGKNEKGNLLYEFRVFTTGEGDVKVRRITLERV